MNRTFDTSRWNEYLETPCRNQSPVKLEVILAARIEAFMKAKKLRLKHLENDKDIRSH